MAKIILFYGDEPYRMMKKRQAAKQVAYAEMNLYVTDVFHQ